MNRPEKERDTLIPAEENRAMFDRIARRYDAANRVLSLGMDRRWRRRAVGLLMPFRGGRYLDIGTGTGDLVFEILDQSANVLADGIDPSPRMLAIAKAKAARRGVGDTVNFFAADARDLPMERETYDGIVCGFSFRNIDGRRQALDEMRRVLKPGGLLVILEAVRPANALARAGFNLYAPLVARVGRLFGGGPAYAYLVESIKHFPSPGQVVDLLGEAGFVHAGCRPLACGAVCIFSGRKQP